MKTKISCGLIFLISFLFSIGSVYGAGGTTEWSRDAEMIYDTGFIQMLMKRPEGGVCLFNMELIENDAPGSGSSEKGVSTDGVDDKNRARKVFYLDDPRAQKAWLVVFAASDSKNPLTFTVNGQSTQLEPWDERNNQEFFRWGEFPAEWLKKGKNTIDLFCPEAKDGSGGWSFYISRADEFEAGGGDPANVGKTSFKSTNGGKSWKESPFGSHGKTRAEYTIRLSLDRYVKTGWLATPVIDLWRGDLEDLIVPLRMIQNVNVSIKSLVPESTHVEYYMRKGTAPGPCSDEWEPYELIGSGPSIELGISGKTINRRYIQLKAVLSTSNPLVSPVVQTMNVKAEYVEYVPLHRNIRVISMDNPHIKYSSIDWEWEKWDRSEFAELRERQNLDTVIAGSTTQFDAQVKLLNHAIRRWIDGGVLPEYPGWNALSILNHIDKTGGGGMCLQNNLLLAGFCMAYGWQARHVNVVSHEVCEVWNDEFGKWIYLDAHRSNHYMYDIETAEPMSVLDLHRGYIEKFFPDRPIDWMHDKFRYQLEDYVYAKRGSLTHHGGSTFNHYCQAAFIRMVPRTNWFEKPYPRPLAHGLSQWPWNGYINWYDEKTPPKRQYSWHTDRPRDMWPDLNKVHIDATSGLGNDCLYLRFETYTPNFSHFEVDENDTGWGKVGARWAWILQSGKNTLRARAVNKLGAKGKPSVIILNHADAMFGDYRDYK